MTLNTIFNKRSFLNTYPSFNGDRFELWKLRFKIFIQNFDFESWKTIINGLFIPTHHINREVVDKPNFIWTIMEKRKSKNDFKTNNFLVISLDDSQLL